MAINNFCELIKKIHADPMKKLYDITVGDVFALEKHLQECKTCATLVDEVLNKYPDHIPDPNDNNGRFN